VRLTDEQKAIVNTDVKRGDCLKVVAFAGTGKTTTLRQYAEIYGNRCLYVAFNKSVEQSAKVSFPTNATCRTVHSLAYQAVGRKYQSNFGFSGNVSPFAIGAKYHLNMRPAFVVSRTIENWCNSADPKITTAHLPIEIMRRISAEEKSEPETQEGMERIVDIANRVWESVVNGEKYFNMTHSGYLKLFQLKKPNLGFDLIMLDEAQDTNPVAFDIIHEQLRLGTRLLMVGDPFQQIYSWRSAIDAMKRFDSETLYLTKSFRFGPEIANAANVLLECFFAPGKPLIGSGDESMLVSTIPQGQSKTIIARTNAYLFENAAQYSQANIPINLAAGSFNDFLVEIMDVFYLYSGSEDKVQSPKLKKFKDYETLADYAKFLDDELSTKMEIVEHYSSRIPMMVDGIRKQTVGPNDAEILLTTCHKAKGMEWETVVVADDFRDLFDPETGDTLPLRRIPTTKQEADAEKEPKSHETLDPDEVNLLYVALTRAKTNLLIRHGHLRVLLESCGLNFVPWPHGSIGHEAANHSYSQEPGGSVLDSPEGAPK
jgi:F-box protein 18 (helicase)